MSALDSTREVDSVVRGTSCHASTTRAFSLPRDGRDTFLGLMKTCQKLGVSFWDYLGARLAIRKGSRRPAPPRPAPSALRHHLNQGASTPFLMG